MKPRTLTIAALTLLLCAPALPMTCLPDGREGRALFTTVTVFSDGRTEAVKDFYAAERALTASIMIPADAIVKKATVQLWGHILDTDSSFTDETTEDFLTGNLTNLSAYDGSLQMRPFLPHIAYSAGSRPSSVACGDLNGDGLVDLAVVNSGASTAGVFRQNRTRGTLEPQLTYNMGQGAQAAAAGDLNGDGREDLAVVCSDAGTLEILYQAGDGSLGSLTKLPSGNGARGVALGDLNRDGRTDAVTVNSVDGTMSLFIQNSSGALERRAVLAVGSSPWAVAVGDVNLDGRNEAVVVCKGDGSLMVFVQDGSGGLVKNATHPIGAGPVSVALGDLNRDGRLDVAVAESEACSVGILTQAPNGSLSPRVGINLSSAASFVAAGDVSYDGRTDLVAACPEIDSVMVLLQQNSGGLGPAELYAVGRSPSSVAVADLNLDGKCDIAVANSGDNGVGVLLLRPTPPSKMVQMVTYGAGTAPIGMCISDLNADGLEDALVGNAGSDTVGVFLQGSDGALGIQRTYSLSSPLGLAVFDLDRDGRVDIIGASQDTNELVLLYQTASGDFTGPAVRYPVNISTGGLYIVACGDLNSDGWPDIAVSGVVISTDEPNIVAVLTQDPASHRFDNQYNLTCNGARGVGIGDVNGDGRNDLCAVASTDSELHIHLQEANGSLSPAPKTYSTDAYPHGLRIGDINHDGRNDVVVACWNANNLNVYYQTASGELASRVALSVSSNGVDVEIGDFDSDGLRDLAVSHYSGSSSITLLNQTRQGAFLGPTTLSTGTRPAMLASGDLNGDGKRDIGVANQLSSNIGVFTQQFSAELNATYISAFRNVPYDIVSVAPSWNATFTGSNQSAVVYVTNDGGQSWVRAVSGDSLTFPEPGRRLGYRVHMSTIHLDRSPRIDNVTIGYTMQSHPIDPAVDIGDLGAPIWNWTGPFGVDSRPASIDFTERLNATIKQATPDENGSVLVPFVLSSGSLGRLRLTNLSVTYDLAPEAPELLSPVNSEFVTTHTPSFRLLARDEDTTELQFRIEISLDNFTTFKTYNQVISNDGWDKSAYRSGEVATFQLSHFDRLQTDGEYAWRALVWDGSVWSSPSEPAHFCVDTRPPTARVEQLPAYQNSTRFIVRWSGSDPDPGSGLAPEKTYDIQYKEKESAPWVDWLLGTNGTYAEFAGAQGKTYYFQARARDFAGNTGSFAMGNGDAQTMVDVTPPDGTVQDDGEVTQDQTRLHAIFSFSDPETGVARYLYWVSTQPDSTENRTVLPTYTESSEVTVSGLFLYNGTRYYFTVLALNGAGSWSAPQSSDGVMVRLKSPIASVSYTGGVQASRTIEFALSSSDPNFVGIGDGDLEYRSAPVLNRNPGEWSPWTEFGEGDWGEPPNSSGPGTFEGEAGVFYRFRYRTKDLAGTYSEYAEPGVFVRVNRPPQPVIEGKQRVMVGKAVSFQATSSRDADGDPLRFTWDFGDGGWGQGLELRHTFKRARSYTVTLYADDGVENVTTSMVVRAEAPAPEFDPVMLVIPTVALGAVLALGAYTALKRRRARAYAPAVVPGTEVSPPPPPATREEAEAELLAARAAIAELDEAGGDTVRASRMLGLAESFLADGNPDMAAQYARKTIRLARDQKERKESEVDEETARQFVNLTQHMLEEAETVGLEVREAKKLFGLSMSFLAEGNYVTGMQYSKKVRKILTELRERQKLTLTREDVEREVAEAERLLEALRDDEEAGMSPEADAARESLGIARMFLEEGDLPPAMDAAMKARGTARNLMDKGRTLSPKEWKDKFRRLGGRLEEFRAEGLRTSEPQKMLKLSESFAMTGNMEVASQYIRKAEKLMRDIEARARADAAKPEPAPVLRCPECGEEIEEDWLVCAFCNHALKPLREKGTGRSGREGRLGEEGPAPRVAKPVDDDVAR
ncbi:MAG: FG-GAP-like repeat-containing protein [Thermoplasmatota archaeon]